MLTHNPPHVVNREPAGDIGVTLTVTDIEERCQTPKDKGVTLRKPIETMPWSAMVL